MKQYESVIKVMEENGGFATLGYLYQNVLKVPDCEWKTKTPYASIRRIVQDQRFFFKIRPGLWALNSRRESVLNKFDISQKLKEKEEIFDHTYYQELLVEIGNLKGYGTFVPNQDKNRIYLSNPLFEYSSLHNFYIFTYEIIVDRAKTIDVVWFNKRKFPEEVFEIEHTTNFRNSLLKFLELQDFNISFSIVSDVVRYNEFQKALSYSAFEIIKKRIKFINYEELSDYHSKTFKYFETGKKLGI